jgi:hypothetical protein
MDTGGAQKSVVPVIIDFTQNEDGVERTLVDGDWGTSFSHAQLALSELAKEQAARGSEARSLAVVQQQQHLTAMAEGQSEIRALEVYTERALKQHIAVLSECLALARSRHALLCLALSRSRHAFLQAESSRERQRRQDEVARYHDQLNR